MSFGDWVMPATAAAPAISSVVLSVLTLSRAKKKGT
jgi:hypothetical protein